MFKENLIKLRYIYFSLVFVVILASCDESTGPVDNIETSLDSQAEQKAFDLVNDYRESKGLNRVEWNETIAEICRSHSRNMALKKVPIGHDGFDDRAAEINKTIPYERAGENVAFNSNYPNPPETAFEGWLNSPPHKENMENDYDMAGMGLIVADGNKYYFTQIFVKTR